MNDRFVITVNHQIADAQREIAMRRRVYPGLVGRGKMRGGEADHLIACMEATSRFLEWASRHEAALKAIDPKVPLSWGHR